MIAAQAQVPAIPCLEHARVMGDGKGTMEGIYIVPAERIGVTREKARLRIKGCTGAVCHLGKGVILIGISVDRAGIKSLLGRVNAAGQG